MIVSVCIITYKRPVGLSRLLEGIAQLAFDRIREPEIEIVVVDNDAAGSAREVCNHQANRLKWPMKYDIEPREGISHARNKAIVNASAEADFIAMIDDDEAPEPFWLQQLISVQRQYHADVVAGPVLPHFEVEHIPTWVVRGKFFQLPRYKTGDRILVAFTGNVLIRASILRIGNPVFDARFSLTGGSDSHLFMRLHQQGYQLVWADEAVVYEWIPKSRVNPAWILRRGYRTWSGYSFMERELYPKRGVMAKRMVKGAGLIVIGILALVPSVFLGKHALVHALLKIYRGAGSFSGLAGLQFEEYKRSSR